MRKLIFESITFATGRITQSLTRWARDYELSVSLIYKRYYEGARGDQLIEPTPCDILYPEDVKQLWGCNRRWIYKPKEKQKPKYFKDNRRWVYVGK